jgi:hypothetical protein
MACSPPSLSLFFSSLWLRYLKSFLGIIGFFWGGMQNPALGFLFGGFWCWTGGRRFAWCCLWDMIQRLHESVLTFTRVMLHRELVKRQRLYNILLRRETKPGWTYCFECFTWLNKSVLGYQPDSPLGQTGEHLTSVSPCFKIMPFHWCRSREKGEIEITLLEIASNTVVGRGRFE